MTDPREMTDKELGDAVQAVGRTLAALAGEDEVLVEAGRRLATRTGARRAMVADLRYCVGASLLLAELQDAPRDLVGLVAFWGEQATTDSLDSRSQRP